MSATEVTADVIADYLAGQELEYERFDERSFAVALPGEKRLKTACLLSVGTHALEIEAFVMRRPDENHEQVYAFLLQRNARMYAVSWALDATCTEVSLIVPTRLRSCSIAKLIESAIAPVISSVTVAFTVRSPSASEPISSSNRMIDSWLRLFCSRVPW